MTKKRTEEKTLTLQEELQRIEKEMPLATQYIGQLQAKAQRCDKLENALDVLLDKLKG